MKNPNSPSRIHWSTSESKLVRQKVLEIVSNRKLSRSSWSDVFEMAQRELPINRRRDNTSLNPNVWLSKTGIYCSNTTQLIAASVLRELGHDIRENTRVGHYAHYLALQSEKKPKVDNKPEAIDQKSEVAVMAVVHDKECPAERIASKLSDARQKMISQILEHEKELVLCVAKEQLDPIKDDMNARFQEVSNCLTDLSLSMDMTISQVQYLGQQISLITEFITSHGYNPKK